MSIVKRVELDNIGFDVGNDPVRQGQVAIRWRKMVWHDGDLVATESHRALIDVDTDLDAVLEANYADLDRMGYGRPPETDRGYIEDAIKRAWTPEVRDAVEADRKAKAEAEAMRAAEQEAREAEAKEAEQMRFDAAVAGAVARQGGK